MPRAPKPSPTLGLLVWWDLEGVLVPSGQVREVLIAHEIAVVDPTGPTVDQRWLRLYAVAPFLAGIHAVSLKRGGGFYFVATEHRSAVERLDRALRALGGAVWIATLENTPEGRLSVMAGIGDHVAAELGPVREVLGTWRGIRRKIRTDSQASLFATVKHLLETLALYERACGLSLMSPRREIEAVRDEAIGILAAATK